MNDDLRLLRRYEPVIRFTRGERFYPVAVDRYVEGAGLWAQRPGDDPVCLVPTGVLSLDALGEPRTDAFGTVYFLKSTEPLSPTELAAYSLSHLRDSDRFRAGRGRLARVGFGSRLIDALFSISLLARGRVPGDSAAAADQAFTTLRDGGERYRYHGRVVRADGWIVLQYWFFYTFNNWRSGFHGANDHEADWEMVCIYLADRGDDPPEPEWVAYASHDYAGDDLRRRWHDPEVAKVGTTHPIIYAGAGSHASYFRQGEYLTEIELPIFKPLARLSRVVQDFWYETLRQYQGERAQARRNRRGSIFLVPFVDYARGDGLSIGPLQERKWADPVLLNPVPAWVSGYRGLWGYYARDPFAGEDAPAGPMYNRDGSVRLAWADPLGWAGLNKVVPSHLRLDDAEQKRRDLSDERVQLRKAAADKTRALQRLQTEAVALRGQVHLQHLFDRRAQAIGALSAEIATLRADIAERGALIDALTDYIRRVKAGEDEPLRAHIHRAHAPASEQELRFSRLAEFWAATSVGLTMIGVVALYLFARDALLAGIVGIIALLTFIEAGFRGRLTQLVTGVTLTLALVAAGVLLVEFLAEIALVAVLAAGGYIVLGNLRELWR